MSALILVVDDNVDLRETMAELLMLEGFEALIAVNGLDALEMLSSGDMIPDIIVSDWRMPDMDGEELYKTLRSDARYVHIPFILMGQFQSSQAMVKQFPDAQFLDKPFSPNELITIIRNIV